MQSEKANKFLSTTPLTLRFVEGEGDGGEQTAKPVEGATPKTEEPPTEGVGDAGQKAIDTYKAQRSAARAEAKAEKERADMLAAQLEAINKPAEQIALDNARKEGESAATAAANARIVKSELKAAAASKLANPADALAFIDTSNFEVDKNGDVDSDALNEAIDDLIKARPYLASGHQLPFQGTADGGAKAQPLPEASLEEQILAAQAKGDFKAVISLQNQKLAALKA